MFIRRYEKVTMKSMLQCTTFVDVQLDELKNRSEKMEFLEGKLQEIFETLEQSLFLIKVEEYDMYEAMTDEDEHDGLWLYEICVKLNSCFSQKLAELKQEKHQLLHELVDASEKRRQEQEIQVVTPKISSQDTSAWNDYQGVVSGYAVKEYHNLCDVESLVSLKRRQVVHKTPCYMEVQVHIPEAIEIVDEQLGLDWRAQFSRDTLEAQEMKRELLQSLEEDLEQSKGFIICEDLEEIPYDDVKPDLRMNLLMYSHQPSMDGQIYQIKGQLGLYVVKGQYVVRQNPEYRVIKGMTRFSLDQTELLMTDEGEVVDVKCYKGRDLSAFRRSERKKFVNLIVKECQGTLTKAEIISMDGGPMVRVCYVSDGKIDDNSYWVVNPSHAFEILRLRDSCVWEVVQRVYCHTGDIVCIRSVVCKQLFRIVRYDDHEGFGQIEKFLKKDAGYYMYRERCILLQEFLT